MSGLSIRSRVLAGSAWTIGGYGFSRTLRLGSHLVLAWLLAPEIFGLMALVSVFMNALAMFTDLGLSQSIIQNKRGYDPVFQNTVWTMQVIRGLGIWLLVCAMAWPYAWWYAQNDPAAWKLLALLPVAGLGPAIGGFVSPALHALKKDLRLAKFTILELIQQLITIAVIIAWALVQPSVWAMVAGSLAGTAAKVVMTHLLVPGHRLRFQWDRECVTQVFHFGRWIFLSSAFSFLAVNLDTLLLGRLLSLSDLGVYNIARVFAMVALDLVSRLGTTVMFPLYSRYQSDPVRLMTVALKSRNVLLWSGGALCISLAVISPLFFETLWDVRYHDAGMIAQLLALDMWARIILLTMDRVPLALGNSRALFMANMIQTAGIVPAGLGYWLAGLPGFIVGLVAGPLAAHLYLVQGLPAEKRPMVNQSFRASILVVCLGVFLAGGTTLLRPVLSHRLWVSLVVLLAVAPVAMAAYVVYKRLLVSGTGRPSTSGAPVTASEVTMNSHGEIQSLKGVQGRP